MPKHFWINLPVKDIKKSKVFYIKVGFSVNEQHGNSDQAQLRDNNAHFILFP
ncbi:hypothetical protein [Peribacillus simplex]|uniref:hypothetical protein n=1 Tax=Peribacillus simplex TaxID=1478 RepID=UPI003D2D6306